MTNNLNIQNTNNIFADFPKYDFGKISNFVPDLESDSFEAQNTKKKNILIGSTIASSILTAGIIAMLAVKGVHGSSIKSISSELSKELWEKGASSTRKTMYYAKKGTDKTLNTLQATSNFTAIKDVFFDKLFSLTKVTSKYAVFTREKFKNIVDSTLGKKYDKVGIKINDLSSLVKEYSIKNILETAKQNPNLMITIKGCTKPLSQWAKMLEVYAAELEESFNKSFSLGARTSRSVKRDNLLQGTKEKVSDIFFKNGGLWKPQNYKTYVTEEVTRNAQNELKYEIACARKKVSNNIENIHESIKDELTDLIHSIKPKDEASIEYLKGIKKMLAEFKDCAGSDEALSRNNLSNKMLDLLKKTEDILADKKVYSEQEAQELLVKTEAIRYMISSANEHSKGALENIMTILKGLNSADIGNSKKIISDIEFYKFKKLSKEISTDLKAATDKEIGEYFLKQAEINVGSAATDIFSVLFPIGVGAYAINKCENTDEKISAGLKTCVPLVGTFATFVYGTIKMLSGAKNLIFSTISGIALNKFGSYLDDLYKDYKKSGSVVKVAKGEYQNVWSDLSVGINSKHENNTTKKKA